jgi:CubicO group peptidase (beta-lactamase class C family)
MRRKLHRAALLPAVLLLVFSIAAGQASRPVAPSLEAAVDRAVGEVMKEGRTPGVAVGVMREGEMILAKGYGTANVEHDIPVNAGTAFRIGSITKQFTSASIMMLVEDGKIAVDDKLSKYFPDFPRGGEVTVRHLLQHTSGIHSYTGSKDWQEIMRRDLTTTEMVEYIQRQTPLYDFDPGTRYLYNNSGYFLLGAIVEKLSGMPIAEFYRGRIFEKLGMTRTSYENEREIVKNRAAGYSTVQAKPGTFQNATYISMRTPGGAGAMLSTVGDLAKWHRALFNGDVVSTASFKEMTTAARLNDGSLAVRPNPNATAPPAQYGFGLMLGVFEGQETIGHGGSINGFNSAMTTFPKQKLTVVILTNATGAARFESAVARAVLNSVGR